MDADRAARLARVVELMGRDLALRGATREGRLRRVQDTARRAMSERSAGAASRREAVPSRPRTPLA